MTDGLERLHYAWDKASGDARTAFMRDILQRQGLRGESEITMTSQVNVGDGSPAVLFRWGEHILIMASETATRHALAILEVALGAEADAFLVAFARDKLGADRVQAGMLLQDFRAWREELARRQATATPPEREP